MSRRISGLFMAISLTTSSGTPSDPGAFPRGILRTSSVISPHVISGTAWFSVLRGHTATSSLGKRASIIESTLPGVESPGIGFLPTSFLVTSLYGRPHGSVSTCLHRSSQLAFLLFLIADFSSFLALLKSCFLCSCSSAGRRRPFLYSRLAITLTFASQLGYFLGHQYVGFFPPR